MICVAMSSPGLPGCSSRWTKGEDIETVYATSMPRTLNAKSKRAGPARPIIGVVTKRMSP